MTKRFRMETIQDKMLPFIVDNSTAKQKEIFTSYKTYETHRKEKCLELVDLLNELNDENKQLKERINNRLHFYRELYEITNDNVVKKVIEDLKDILR